ncbi:MAG: VWA domain-containing protein [Armatimonadetes bacterium]|nr:VWA domain-containing protein [Armatimonadota bacterium]
MVFTSPVYALLLIPVVAGLVFSWRHVHGMAKGRKRFAFVVRAVLAALCVAALCGPQSRQPNRGTATMFVVDCSDSVSDQDKKAANAFVNGALQRLGDDDLAGVVAFGALPVLDSAPAGRRSFGGIQSKVDGSVSDMAAAMRLAMATMPQGKGRRIVVLSDGNENRGDATQAAEVAGTEGVQVDFVGLGTKPRPSEVAVVEMRTPSERRAEEPFESRVVIDSTVRQVATVVIDRDGTVIARQPVQLDVGRTTFVLDQKLLKPGFYRYRATVLAREDGDSRNNVGASFTTVRGKPRVLLLQGDASKHELADAFRAQGIDVALFGAEGIPVRPEDVQPYDAVVLNDLNAALVTPGQMRTLQSAVRDTGVGLVMVGGENSFLPGGWYGTPVAEALPVDLNIRQRKTYPSTTVLIVIDASGSMGMIEDGVEKLQLAGKAAEETVKLLSPLDRVGVAGSTDGIELVAPIQELKDKDSVVAQIKKLRVGGGGIYSGPSVRFADSRLRASDSKVRHFLLLADGNDVDSYEDSIDVVSKMKQDKITTSVVAIGDGKDVPFLRALATAGGGRFYLANKAAKLPAIFTQDVAVMSRSAIEEMVFVPELKAGEEALRGFASNEFPALFAYCLADPRPLSRVGLVSPKRDPILASWQYGLGTSYAFLSDAQSRWASRWMGWDGFGRFWGQIARSVSRKATQNDYDVDVVQAGGVGKVTLKGTDRLGNPVSGAETTVRVSSPSGRSQDLTLTQEAPGEFSAEFKADELGSYIVSVAEGETGDQRRVTSSGFSVAYPPEYRSYRTNTSLLGTVAQLGNGQGLKDPSEALRPLPYTGRTATDLWGWFLLAAAVLLPFDIAVRRLALPLAQILAAGWSRVTGRKTERQAATVPMTRLKRAKETIRTVREASEPARPAPAPERAEVPVPENPVETTHVSAATKLLESRKKRKGQGP